jgi:glutamyl-tRNA synthetase
MVRIEDTDKARFVPGCEEENIESLTWLGITWDEGPDKGGPNGPYRQSERKEQGIYVPYIQKLLDGGFVYKAFDTPEELAEMREYQQINKQPIGYFGGIWRDASLDQVAKAEAEGKPHVLRLKMPTDRILSCQDAIRGRIEWGAGTTDDQVLIKADGMPTYHFAAMVDDHLWGITHVIRGEEWISSTPKHVYLLECLGWEPPIFVHTTVIKGRDGSKLSKRHGDTRCLDYRAGGYLPEALANFIALIGWAPGGDRELMTLPEMVGAFGLEGLQASPGIFDIEKLRWMNGHYIRGLSAGDLETRLSAYLAADDTFEYWSRPDFAESNTVQDLKRLKQAFEKDRAYAMSAALLEQERVVTLADFGAATAFFFEEEPPMDPKATDKWFGEPHVGALFDHLLSSLNGNCSVETCEALVRGYAQQLGIEKLGPVVHPIRVALTGKTVGPGLFELMSVLGSERMAKRLNRAKGMLKD